MLMELLASIVLVAHDASRWVFAFRWSDYTVSPSRLPKTPRVVPDQQPDLDVDIAPLVEADELRYLAGFFDADGTVGIYEMHRKDRYLHLTRWALAVAVVGLHRGSIERYQRAFGGYLREITPRRSRERLTWRWQANGPQAKYALAQLLPYLNVKKAQAFEACKYPFGWKNYPHQPALHAEREKLALRIKTLKQEIA